MVKERANQNQWQFEGEAHHFGHKPTKMLVAGVDPKISG